MAAVWTWGLPDVKFSPLFTSTTCPVPSARAPEAIAPGLGGTFVPRGSTSMARGGSLLPTLRSRDTRPAPPPLMPASGSGKRLVRSQWGVACALTFLHNRVGRKVEEKLGVGRKLQGLVRKENSLSNWLQGSVGTQYEKSLVGLVPRTHSSKCPSPKPAQLQQSNWTEGGHRRGQGDARATGKPHSSHSSPVAHRPLLP